MYEKSAATEITEEMEEVRQGNYVSSSWFNCQTNSKNIKITAFVKSVGSVSLDGSYKIYNLKDAENNIVRCPDKSVAKKMEKLIIETRKKGDTIGGVVSCVITGSPVGLGEPVFDKLHAELGKQCFLLMLLKVLNLAVVLMELKCMVVNITTNLIAREKL